MKALLVIAAGAVGVMIGLLVDEAIPGSQGRNPVTIGLLVFIVLLGLGAVVRMRCDKAS